MEFKFTKGKWEINPIASMNIRCNNLTVANSSQGQNGENEIEEKHNALLISKAPEMLEMLQKCRTQLILCTLLDKSGQCSEMVEKIEQLIKEATELN
jgi:hypothetical protein